MEGVKITHFFVILTPGWELEELFFRSKNDPIVGVKSGVNVLVHERGYPVPKIFTPLLELK